MSMMIKEVYDAFRAANVPEDKAAAAASAFTDALATKQDLLSTKQQLMTSVSELGTRMSQLETRLTVRLGTMIAVATAVLGLLIQVA